MKKLLLCAFLCLLVLLTVACTGNKGDTDTTIGETTPVTNPVTDEETTDEETTEEETTEEATTEAETVYEPSFDPTVFVPTEVPSVNVAREGFGMASSSRNDAGYSNLNLNDGDYATKFSTGDVWDTATQFWVFVDLTKTYAVDSVKLYPATGDEAGFPKAFEVLTSMDGNEYTSATTVTGVTATAEGYEVALNGVDARFVKIVTKELQAPANGRGCYFALGEIEICADVDTAANAILNRHDAWLYVNPNIPMQLEVLYNRDGSAVGSDWKYMTTNPDVAMVDSNGLVTPISVGTAEIYVTDGTNQSVCLVEVKDQGAAYFHVETFYSPSSVDPALHGKAIDIMKGANIEYLGGVDIYDRGGNVVGPYYIFLCNERGMAYQVRDEETDGKFGGNIIPGVTAEELIRILQKYEHRAGFYGVYLIDEPTNYYLKYAELVYAMHEYNPHIEGYLNQFPLPSVPGDWDTYLQDVASISGGHGRLYYLSFDLYPYMEDGTYHPWFYTNMDTMRRAGLLYDCATAYYLQNYWSRSVTPSEQMYNASVGIAYGMKKYQWFIAMGNADYGILNPSDMSLPRTYAGTAAASAYIRSLGPVLGTSDAIEVYHTNEEEMEVALLPSDFVFRHVGGGNAIYSLFEALDGSGKQHVVIVNKNYAEDGAVTFTVKAADGLRDLKILDQTTGEMVPLTVAADGTFTLDLAAGQCAVIELPDGFDASRPDVETDNLALNKPAYVSSNASDFWTNTNYSGMYLTDGDTDENAWSPASDDEASWIKLDLGKAHEIDTVKIHMTRVIWNRRCKDFTISVSEDGVNYTEVAVVQDFEWNSKTKCADFTFDKTNARYIRIDINTTGANKCFGEIEVYG